MPGEPFFPLGDARGSCLRLNFSHASEAAAATGLERLAGLLREAETSAA